MNNSTLLSCYIEDPSSVNYPNMENSIFQILQLNEYNVQCQVLTHSGDGNLQGFINKISLKGIPAGTNCDVEHAELLFFSDDRQIEKARYDNVNKRIWAFYPISNFDRIYNLLKSTQNKIQLIFYQNPTFETIEVTLFENGKMPIS